MNIYEYTDSVDKFVPANQWNYHRYSSLPQNSTVLFNSNLIKNAKLYLVQSGCELHEFVHWFLEFQKTIMRSDLTAIEDNVFIDFSYDPCVFLENQIERIVDWVQDCFKTSKIWWLSGDSKYFKTTHSKIIYYPYWFLNNVVEFIPLEKQYRIGCLNRNPAKHRHQLMYSLLSQGLLDHTTDRYSWNFNWPGQPGALSFGISNIENFMNLEIHLNNRNYISNCYDQSPNDHSITHPAWQAYLQVITETSPYDNGIVTEKTIKGILSQSLFTVITSKYSSVVFTMLGFDIDYFDEPAIVTVKKFQKLEELKEHYYSEHNRIKHNLDWFMSGSWKPIYNKYLNSFF